MAQIVILEDFKEAQKAIGKLNAKIAKIKGKDKEFAALLSSVVYADILDHFEQEQGSKGSWPEWSDAYKEHMKRIGKAGNKILQDTGRLRQAFQPTSYRVVSEGVLWFNKTPYAHKHDDGNDGMPKRDFMWLSEAAQEKINTLTLNFITED